MLTRLESIMKHSLIGGALLTVAGISNGAPTVYTDEALYLAELERLGYSTIHESFEDSTVWADSRNSVSSPGSTPSAISQGIVWTSNYAVNDIATGTVGGSAPDGSFAIYSLPHGMTTDSGLYCDSAEDPDIPVECFQNDGLKVASATGGTLYAFGGRVDSSTGTSKITFLLDGVDINATVPDNIDNVLREGDLADNWSFIGVIDADGFLSAELRELAGKDFQQVLVFGDDFTVAAGAAVPVPLPAPAAAVLPASRSVQVGNTATAFATTINIGNATATDCGIAPLTSVQADFSYQTTDASNALTGTPNTPIDIGAGGSQSYVFAFTPTALFSPVDVRLTFDCTNTDPAAVTVGLNTLLLVADSNPVPDIIALAATLAGDGVVNLASAGIFSVATVNVGTVGSISVSADTGGASLPVSIALCETDPATGVCINPTVPASGLVTTSIAADATPTFAFFVTATDTVPFDPANNRIFVRFKDAGGVTRGSTSVAVRTL